MEGAGEQRGHMQATALMMLCGLRSGRGQDAGDHVRLNDVEHFTLPEGDCFPTDLRKGEFRFAWREYLKYRMLPVDRVKSFAVERHATAHKIYMVAEVDSEPFV